MLMPADKADAFEADLVALQATMRRRVEEAYAARTDKHWVIWHDFCVSHNFDPLLRGFKDPIPYLQVFGARYRDGSLAPRGNPVAVGTISDAIRSVGQTLNRWGATDATPSARLTSGSPPCTAPTGRRTLPRSESIRRP